MINISPELKILTDFIVSKAGPRLLQLRTGASRRDWKAQTDFRTAADVEIETLIVGEMRRHFPDLNIYSEEAGEIGGSGEVKLVLDPIDGTVIWSTGFADYYSIAAAFLEAGRLDSSVIYFPELSLLYLARRGEGAWRSSGNGAWERILASREENFQHAIVAVDHGKETRQAAPPIMHHLLAPLSGVTCVPQFLCSSYTLVKLAEGAIHGYVSPSSPCEDALPGLLMALEAGAAVGTLAGRGEWSSTERSVVVGCTDAVYQGIWECLKLANVCRR